MASRYWVGGTATWDGTAGTKWSLTSGGAGGEAVPTSADDVFLDAASGAVTVTINTATANCLNLDCTGFTGTLVHSAANLLIYGSMTLVSGMTFTPHASNFIGFRATATGKTVTTAGKALSAMDFNGIGGAWTLQDDVNTATRAITHPSGTLDTNGKTITCGTFSSNSSGVRTLTLGASVINCTSFTTATVTGLTLNEGTSSIRVTGSGAFSGGGETFYEVQLNGTSHAVSGTNTFSTLTRTGTATKTDSVTFSANQTVTGTLTLTGNSATNRLYVASNTRGTARTITAAAVSISNADFEDITGAGAAIPFTGTSLGDCWGNSNITFDTPVNRYLVGGTGNWSDTARWSASSGGASGASVPLPQDTARTDANSGGGTLTTDMPRIGNYYEDVARAVTPSALTCYGSYSRKGSSFSGGTPTLTLSGRGTHTVQGNLGTTVTFDAPGGTYTLTANVDNINGNSTLTRGSFVLSSFTYSGGSFASSNSNTRSMDLGSGTMTVSNASTPWDLSTTINLTLTAGTSTIRLTNATTSAKTFAGGGKTYNNLEISGAGIATYKFTGSNTFNTISSTKTVAHTLLFTAGTTTTVANWSINGTLGNVVTVGSVTAASHTLAKSGGGTITMDYASISRSTATPGSTWFATNSTDGGNNSGWSFSAATPTGNGLLFGSNF